MRDVRGGRTQHAAHVALAVRADHRRLHAAGLEFGEHLRRAAEQSDLVDVARGQFPQVLGDHRQLPGRHAEIVQDRAGLEPAQPLAVAGRKAPIAEAVRHLVEDAEEPVLAVGQRAVEVEQGEAVAHEGGLDG